MKNLKKALALFLCALLLVSAFAGCSAKKDGGDDKKVVKIGVYEPASGDRGAGGKQETLGIQYAHSQVNTVEIGGETYSVELEIVDNEGSNDKGPAAASMLVSAGVSVALGSYGSSVSIAASDVFKNANIPVIGISCTNPQVTEGNTHYFRICFIDPFQGTVLGNYAAELGAKKAYALAKLGDDFTVGLCNYFTEAFEAINGEGTVITETYPEGNSDFTSYLTTAVNSGADVIFAPIPTEAAALIIDQAQSQGIDLPFLAGDTWDSNVILEAAKGTDLDIYVTTFFDEGDTSEAGSTFVKGFKEWLNANPDMLTNNGGNDTVAACSAMGYDGYMVALEALKAAGSTDPVKVNEALWDVTHEGVTGAIVFDDVLGDAQRDVAYIKEVDTATGMWKFVRIQGVN